MRHRLTFTLISLSFAACSSPAPAKPDAKEDIGFNTPTKTLKANREVSEDNWMEIGDADLTCLNMPSADQATTVSVTLNSVVKDFQTGNSVPGAKVIAFANANFMQPFEPEKTADGMALVSFTVPVGTKRFGFKMQGDSILPTFLLNQTIKPNDAIQPAMSDTDPSKRLKIQSVSNATAALLPALIGETRKVGTGVLAGALRDCQNREISNFIATVSSVKGMATTVTGADTYYFSSSVGLPVHHNQQGSASEDGLFMIIQIPPTATAYVQMWGFPTQADLDGNMLKLIAELEVPVLADTVITGSYEPLRN